MKKGKLATGIEGTHGIFNPEITFLHKLINFIDSAAVFFYLFEKDRMPQSRKRHGHHEYRKPSDIPAKQRTKGRITWAILFGVFGLMVGFFAAGQNYVALVTGAFLGAVIGYMIGKNMEKEATQ